MKDAIRTRKTIPKKPKRGAPVKPDHEKVRADHLRQDQWDRMEEEAAMRGISTWAFIRQSIDWTITALDTKRGDSDAHKLFDNIMEE